jgi:hypothetical protein
VNVAAVAEDAVHFSPLSEQPERLPGELDEETLRKYFTLTRADPTTLMIS